MGFLQKLFSGKEGQFQQQVVSVLQKQYPSLQVQAAPAAMSVLINGVELDLQKIHAVCRQNETQTADFIQQYFSYPAALSVRAGKAGRSEVELRVRPQLVPTDFAERFGVVTFPFVPGVAAGLVLRGDSEMPFLRPEDLRSWGFDPKNLYEKSLANLDADKAEMEITITDGTDRFIGMETHDGFDAVRILLPRVLKFATEKLGATYFAGMPNRSFLILWSRDCSPRFQDYAVEKIETDFAIQPFPLSSARFEVTESGIRET